MSRTRLFVTTAIILIGIFDIISVNWFGSAIEDNCGHTISQFFQAMGSYPLITGTMFYLAGHFWGVMTPTMPAAKRIKLLKLAQEIRTVHSTYLVYKDWAPRLEEIAGR